MFVFLSVFQVTDKIKEIKLTLADCLFCWCCQSPLSKTDTQALMNYLRSVDDDSADGTLSDVTLKLLMAFLYNIDPRVPECEQGPGKEMIQACLFWFDCLMCWFRSKTSHAPFITKTWHNS